MKSNLKVMKVVAAMAVAMIGAAITLLLAGEANWLKFAGWTIFFAALQNVWFMS